MKPRPGPRLFADRAAWRAWLARNHATAGEAWLLYYKKGSGKRSVTKAEAIDEALCFGWIDSIIKSVDDERYQQRFTPRSERSKWSAINKRRVAELEREGRMTAAGRARIEAAKQSGWWHRVAEVSVDPAVAAALDAALADHPAARARFDKLPPSHRKQYLLWISDAKREETRQRRIAQSIERILAGRAPGM